MYHFIISGKTDTKRREHIRQEWKKLGEGIEPNFFDAVMGRDMTEEERDRALYVPGSMMPGEIGCALSHLGVYKEFLASDHQSVFIFEDDVFLADDISLELLEELQALIEAEEGPVAMALFKGTHGKKVYKRIGDIDIIQSPHFYCTHAYILNRAAAGLILKAQTPLRFPIDGFKYYYWFYGLRLYTLNKNLGYQQFETLGSSIEHERESDTLHEELMKQSIKKTINELSLKGKIKYFIRRMEKHL